MGEASHKQIHECTSLPQHINRSASSDRIGYGITVLLLSGSRAWIKKLAFDLSSIFSRSENINMAQAQHNPDHTYLPQINTTLVLDIERYMPHGSQAA